MITCRPMRPKDVRECCEIVAAHPVVGRRYGDTLPRLVSVWRQLLGQEGFRPAVFDSDELPRRKLVAVGVSVFVTDEFLAEIKTPPFCWVGPQLVKRCSEGRSPILSDRQVREANADGGLNLVVWEGTARVPASVEVHQALFFNFAEQHRGFLLNEIICNTVSMETLEGTLRTGGMLLNRVGEYSDSADAPLPEILSRPHFVGLNRSLARQRLGTWMGAMFMRDAPRFDFRPSEQRLLVHALQGGTDEELADEIGISLSAVKKAWRAIYDRVGACDSTLVPVGDNGAGDTSERGREKKRHLLSYLREHPEELRPATL